MVRILVCVSLLACGARTELGVGTSGDAGVPDVHAPIDAAKPCELPDITATIRATADDAYVLYVNDDVIDSTPHIWSDAKQYMVTIHRDPTRRNTIAVEGTNEQNTGGRDRGILLDLRFATEAGDQVIVTTDAWRLATSAPPLWYETTFDASTWQNATSEGPYPEGPWGTVFAPFGIDSQAQWLWSYDSNQPASSKVVQETVYVRRDFYIDASGHVGDGPSACAFH